LYRDYVYVGLCTAHTPPKAFRILPYPLCDMTVPRTPKTWQGIYVSS
jgi:hypothetical protein